MNKHKCDKCDAMAIWLYMPSDSNSYYCDNCIKRGCSCNIIYDDLGEPTEEEFTDERGRLLPCCEYIDNEEGFEINLDEEECKPNEWDDIEY